MEDNYIWTNWLNRHFTLLKMIVFLWVIIIRKMPLTSLWTSNHFTTYFCPGDTLFGWMGACAHMNNNSSYSKGFCGVNYVLSCTTEEPDRAQVLLEGNLFFADLQYITTSAHMHSLTAAFLLVRRNQEPLPYLWMYVWAFVFKGYSITVVALLYVVCSMFNFLLLQHLEEKPSWIVSNKEKTNKQNKQRNIWISLNSQIITDR